MKRYLYDMLPSWIAIAISFFLFGLLCYNPENKKKETYTPAIPIEVIKTPVAERKPSELKNFVHVEKRYQIHKITPEIIAKRKN